MTATFVAGPCFLLPKTKGVNEVRIVEFRRKLANNFQIFEVFSPRFDKDCGSELILLLLTFMVDTNSARGGGVLLPVPQNTRDSY